MSECFGAGTGCGWCRPYLKKIFEQFQANSSIGREKYEETTQLADEFGAVDWENLSSEQYAQQRANYIQMQKERDSRCDE
jgi:NAD(P)H-nitrite reductase large subunit